MPLLYTEHSLDFDGTDDNVLVGNVAELSFDTGDAFSMSCWVKVDAVSAYHIFMGKKLGGASPARGYEFGIFNTGECFFALANNAPTSDIGVRFGGVSDLVGTGWHHVVVTYDGSGTAAGTTAYIDAESRAISVDSDDLAGSILEPTALFRLGSSTTTNFYDGRLAEASVYDKELTPSEVSAIYNAGSPPDLTSVGPTGNLVGYWRPGEHTFPTVPDLSASGNDGTMTNMAADDIVVDAPRPHEAFFSMLYDSDGEYCEQGVADPDLDFSETDDFTISVWVKAKVPATGAGTIISCADNLASYHGWSIRLAAPNKLLFQLANGALSSSIYLEYDYPTDVEWHHVLVTHESHTVVTYVDASPVAPTSSVDNLAGHTVNSAPVRIGRLNAATSTQDFRGAVSDAAIWGTVLTPSQVTDLYGSGVPRDPKTIGENSTLLAHMSVVDRADFPSACYRDLVGGNDLAATNMEAADVRMDAPEVDFEQPSSSTESIFWAEADAPGWVEVGYGPHMLFNGSDTYVELLGTAADASYDFDLADPMTLSAWIFVTSYPGSARAIMEKGWISNPDGFKSILLLPGGTIRSAKKGFGTVEIRSDTTNLVPLNQWTHVVFTAPDGDRNNARVWLNGVEETLVHTYTSASGPSTSPSVNWIIGGGNDGQASVHRFFDGYISNAYIGTAVADQTFVDNLYALGPRGDISGTPGALSTFRLDGPPGTTTVEDGAGAITAEVNGTMDYQLVAPELVFDSTDPFTISAWVRYTGGGTLIGNLTPDSTARGWELFIDPPFGDFNVYFSSNSGSGNEFYLYTDYRYDDDKWHHVCVVYQGDSDPNNIVLYVDGVSHPFTVDTDNLSGSIASLEAVKMGKTESEDTSYDGYMDDVAIYNKALSEEEVRTVYGSRQANDLTETMPLGNLAGYWKLGDGSDTFPNIADLSPFGYDGIMSGYLHTHYIANDRPPGVDSTQYSIGIGGRYDATDPLLDFGRTDPFSLALWFRNDSPTTWFPTLVSHQTPTGYVIEMQGDAGENPGGVMFSVFGPTGTIRASTDTAYNDGTWYHAVITYDGSGLSSGITFYIDGAVSAHTVHEDTLGAEDFYAATPYRIYDGLITGSGGYIGSTCQHAVYDKELTAGEVTTIYGAGTPPNLTSVGPTGNLVAWWPVLDTDLSSLPNLDDAGSNDITMVSWSTNTSIVSEAPAQYVSQYSTEFDGVNDVAIIGDVPELSFERTDPFTLSAWARVGLLWSFAPLIAKRDGSNVGWGLFLWDSDEIRFNLTNSTNTNEIELGYATIGAGSWHNFVVTYDGSSSISGVRVYQNGVELTLTVEYENNLSGSIVNAGDATIGLSQGQELRGLIDEVAVYNRVLSPSEVDRLGGDPDRLAQDHGAVGPLDSLVGWWRMGDPGPSVFPTIADESVSRNDATLTNMDSGDIVEEAPYLAVAGDIDWSTYAWPIDTAGPWQPAGVAAPPQADPVTGEPIGEEDPPYYKMRALADPGPGYVTWVVTNSPDFAGAEAPSAIQGGSAVLTTSWNDDGVQFVRVPSIDIIQPVTNSAAATDPGIGLSLVLVDTADAAWDDLDTITLPAAPQAGAEIIVKDDGGQAASERISVLGNGNNIDGQASRLVQSPREALHLLFDGTEWRVV